MSDLTDFLLARIAEDEAGNGCHGEGEYETCFRRSDRIERECEAKRRQIEHLVRFMEGDYAPWNEEQLQIMATVYADHPDYREEWRP